MTLNELIKECERILQERRELDLRQSVPYCPFLLKVSCPYVEKERIRVPELHGSVVVKVKYYTCRGV